MTKATLCKQDNRYCLEMDNHAGKSEVCNACSMMAGLMGQIAYDAYNENKLIGTPIIEFGDGTARIEFETTEDLSREVAVVKLGIELIEDMYPENLNFINMGV